MAQVISIFSKSSHNTLDALLCVFNACEYVCAAAYIYAIWTRHTHSLTHTHTLLIMQLNRALGGFKTFYA